ncbi:type IV toxin-antitoxin system AbiEi family antitoxin domain-containing protein [Candidatus Woesearchaeota archaeon]|nr:type IV toxin-antitoxin system AbiEi family antitoxin domain-containing protein [Candidatus Woesearchaeota archaeon]
MEGLSRKEMEIVSWLEFYNKYFFSSSEIDRFAKSRTQRYNFIKNLLKKKRIVKLSRGRYYLITTKAKSGSWAEHSFILADETCSGKDYVIGGWAAANYWHLTDQIPMQIDVYTTKRQGVLRVLNTRIVFHRTTERRVNSVVVGRISNHPFRIEKKEDAKKWLKSTR